MTTLQGTWSYSYDTVGQLTGAVFAPSAGSSIPAQSLSYTYNSVGDLTQSVINGVTYLYTSNPDNQYTTVTSASGTTSYTYNANGDLVSETDPSGTTTYYVQLAQSARERDVALRHLAIRVRRAGESRFDDRERPDDRQPGRSHGAGQCRGAVRSKARADRSISWRPMRTVWGW